MQRVWFIVPSFIAWRPVQHVAMRVWCRVITALLGSTQCFPGDLQSLFTFPMAPLEREVSMITLAEQERDFKSRRERERLCWVSAGPSPSDTTAVSIPYKVSVDSWVGKDQGQTARSQFDLVISGEKVNGNWTLKGTVREIHQLSSGEELKTMLRSHTEIIHKAYRWS